MDSEAAKLAATADAARLRACDGPHMRAWMRDDRDGFVAAAHRVADLALAVHELAAGGAVPTTENTLPVVLQRGPEKVLPTSSRTLVARRSRGKE